MDNSLLKIPGVGVSVAARLQRIGIKKSADLCRKNPETLFDISNEIEGSKQDRCLLYTFRCAIYFAQGGRDPEKLKWWHWKDKINKRK